MTMHGIILKHFAALKLLTFAVAWKNRNNVSGAAHLGTSNRNRW